MKEEIDEVIRDVLRRRDALRAGAGDREGGEPAHGPHRHRNQEFQALCNGHLLPLLAEVRQALLDRHIPAQVAVHPEIGFQKSEGVALVVATHEFHGADLLGSAHRVFVLFELDADGVSLSVQVGGNNTIADSFPPQGLPLSETSLGEVRHLLKGVVREAASIFFGV